MFCIGARGHTQQETGEDDMTIRGMNRIIGQAVISDRFRMGLLNGRRAELIRQPEFELDPEEAMALLSIQAENLAEFAVAVEGLLDQRLMRPAEQPEMSMGSPLRRPNQNSLGAFARH